MKSINTQWYFFFCYIVYNFGVVFNLTPMKFKNLISFDQVQIFNLVNAECFMKIPLIEYSWKIDQVNTIFHDIPFY